MACEYADKVHFLRKKELFCQGATFERRTLTEEARQTSFSFVSRLGHRAQRAQVVLFLAPLQSHAMFRSGGDVEEGATGRRVFFKRFVTWTFFWRSSVESRRMNGYLDGCGMI
jgi:hypothetical protein